MTWEYDKELYEKTDRGNDIQKNIEVMGEQLKHLAKNIKDDGDLLRKYELAYYDVMKVFTVHGMSSTSQANIIERNVGVIWGVKSIQGWGDWWLQKKLFYLFWISF